MKSRIRSAFVLGAGLGTRLRPLTEVRPKPLIPIFGKPLITFALDHLIGFGVESFVINTHHLSGQFEEYFRSGEYRSFPVHLIHEPDLLETGGGIKNAEALIEGDTFLVYSGDLLTDIDLERLCSEHETRKNAVTLALRNTHLAQSVAFQDGKIVDIGNRRGHPGNYDFANISVWSREIFQWIAPKTKTSFVPVIREWIEREIPAGGVVLNDKQWFNIGSRAEYLAVHQAIAKHNWKPDYIENPTSWPQEIAPDATIARSAQLKGACCIGPGCTIGEDAFLEDSILWENVEIASQSRLDGCIVRQGRKAEGTLSQADI